MSDSKPVVLGHISGLFGVKGWVKVHSYTKPREAILDYPDWLIEVESELRLNRVAEGKRHGKTVIAHLRGINDRDEAAALIDCVISVPRDALPETAEDEHYWTDLEGLQVVHRDGTVLGKVSHLLETGANDVLVVQGDQELLIPFVKEDVVESVDLDKGIISVNWEWN
ncbi:MAG: ribosome maturation factor RimM [Woeseiaceae bacterium]